MALGDNALAGVGGSLRNRAGAMSTMHAAPWHNAEVHFRHAPTSPGFGKFAATHGRHGNHRQSNGGKRRPSINCACPPACSFRAAFRILPSGPGAPQGGSCHMALPCVQCLQAWFFDKLQHAPPMVNNKRATHIVPLATGPPPQVAESTPRNMWNHVRGAALIPPRSEPRFIDTVPTLQELRWQLTQAATAAQCTWVPEAMARHGHVAPPLKRSGEPSQPPAPTPAV